MVYFPLGHLLKDHDYEDKGTIKSHNLEIILRKGASEMTEGDLHYFLSNISNDKNEVDSQKLIADINYYVKDRDKRQILETHIPAKILNPIGFSDSDQRDVDSERRHDRRASKGDSRYDDSKSRDGRSKSRDISSKLDKLNEEIARKIEKNKVDIDKF